MRNRQIKLTWAITLLAFFIAFSGLSAAEFQSNWPTTGQRVWIGGDFYANRLYDWQMNDGRLECLEGSRAKPMRTIHLLTHAVGEQRGELKMTVRTGPIDPQGKRHQNTWTGFLIGVGGSHVDYRVSALCHHWPADDGGLIVAIDGTGEIVFRDNTNAKGPKGPKGNITVNAWPLLDSSKQKGPGGGPTGDIDLTLEAVPSEKGYRVTLTARDHISGELIRTAQLDGVSASQLDGNVALISHQSPKQKGPGYWYRDWHVSGSKVESHPSREFGPVMCAQYTLSRGILKMTAQMGPLGKQDAQTAQLQIRDEAGSWKTVSTGKLIKHSYTIPFRVEHWDNTKATPYRIVYQQRVNAGHVEPYYYEGTIRREPTSSKDFVVAAFTGHHISAKGKGNWNFDSIWYPHNELVAAINHHNPDLLFFSGDQIYEGGLAGIVRDPAETATLDYLYHWYRWCWAFRDLARDRPCICLPDDHDVYHGNVWGAGGRATKGKYGKQAQDSGGYQMAPLFVNVVHATQTSHLPDPVDPRPIEQDISVYFTRMEYGGISFAILADRMWKSAPAVMVPKGNVVNGWFHNRDFDPAKEADTPGSEMLGPRQEKFLEQWAGDWSDHAKMKVVLSQTIFANVATLPKEAYNDTVVPRLNYAALGEYIIGDAVAADCDSNGWPQTPRNRALRAMRRGFAFHIAGDQHLGSFIQYGADEHNDAGYALCVPSIANVWPRRWFPPQPGNNRQTGSPKYTGEFLDGFGNKMTVHAVSNPVRSGHKPEALYDRVPGYGIVRFNRQTRDIVVECWPRWVDPSQPNAKQYAGWPFTISQFDNYGRKGVAYLPTLEVVGMKDPVVQVIDQANGEIVYTVRIIGQSFQAKVFKAGTYTIKVGEPADGNMREIKNLAAEKKNVRSLRVTF